MLPRLPEFPVLPELCWEYKDGRYSLSEEDVDKLLSYFENDIALYKWELGQYEKKLEVVVNTLQNDST